MSLALTGLSIWDGLAESLGPPGRTLRVEGARIAGIGRNPRLRDDAREIDCSGLVALPGLMDAHVHLCLDPAIATWADHEKQDDATRLAGMRARAESMARAGVTTARDLGGPSFRELELRDSILRGEAIGPRLLCAGQPLTSPRGHCWFWGGEVDGENSVARVTERQVGRGVDWLKVMATGGLLTKGTTPSRPQFEESALEDLVLRARAAGKPVAAHCHGTDGIRRAARAGVRSIEHCSFANEEGFGADVALDVVRALADSRAFVSPTVNQGFARFVREAGALSKTGERFAHAYGELRRAGVPLVASTDAGIPGIPHDGMPRALPTFARLAGLSNADALRSATSVAARELGIGRLTGSLVPGLEADVLIVDGDPLQDLAALTRPIYVLTRGRLVRG